MMRHKNYILFLGVLLFAACSEGEGTINEPAISDKPTEEQPANNTPLPIDETDEPIVFSASVDEDKANTRTVTPISGDHTVLYGLTDTDSDGHTDFYEGIETNADLKQTGFGTYAYYTKDMQIGVDDFIGDPEHREKVDQTDKVIVMLNQEVEWDDTKWTYSPMRFWPGNQNYMSFFAYAPYSNTSHPSIGTEGTNYWTDAEHSRPYYHFKFLEDIQIPKSTWTFANQQDLLWGACKVGDDTDPPTGLGGMAYKNIKLADSDNGTLHWRFRHALARVKFSLYFNFGDFYSSPNVSIPSGREVYNSAKGASEGSRNKTVGDYGNPVPLQYAEDPEHPEHPELNGYYVKLNEWENTAICHKYEELTESSLLVIITGVKFKNYVQSANLSYDNTEPRIPVWENKTYDTTTGFSVPADLLNPNISMSKTALEGLSYNYDWTTLPHWGQNTDEPLFVLPGDGMEGKNHYTLFVPTTQDLELVISYKIVRAYKLTGYYLWQDNKPVPYPELGAFTMTGITGHEAGSTEYTSTARINPTDESGQTTVGFEPHKSYSVSMHLGKLMRVLFEVTDWDVPESISIDIPPFD